MQTRQKNVLQIVFDFFREKNLYVSQIFTPDNYIFHREKQQFFVHNFLLTPQQNFLTPQQSLLTPQQSLVEAQQSLVEAQQNLVEAQQSLVEAQQSLVEAQQSLVEAQESKNTRKMVGFFITWLLYSQNPLRSNMAQPYRLIVWI